VRSTAGQSHRTARKCLAGSANQPLAVGLAISTAARRNGSQCGQRRRDMAAPRCNGSGKRNAWAAWANLANSQLGAAPACQCRWRMFAVRARTAVSEDPKGPPWFGYVQGGPAETVRAVVNSVVLCERLGKPSPATLPAKQILAKESGVRAGDRDEQRPDQATAKAAGKKRRGPRTNQMRKNCLAGRRMTPEKSGLPHDDPRLHVGAVRRKGSGRAFLCDFDLKLGSQADRQIRYPQWPVARTNAPKSLPPRSLAVQIPMAALCTQPKALTFDHEFSRPFQVPVIPLCRPTRLIYSMRALPLAMLCPIRICDFRA